MFELWKLSHLDTRFYRHVGQFSGWRILFYLIGFYLLLGVALSTLFAIRTWPKWKNNVQLTWESTRQQWPQNAVVQLRDNELHILPATEAEATAAAALQKIELRWPNEVIKNSRLPSHLVVIEPQANLEQLQQYPSWFVATQNALWIQSSSGRFENFPWREALPEGNLTINTAFWEQQQANFSTGLNASLYPLLLLAFLWYGFVRLMLRCVSLLLMSWLAQPVLTMFGWQIDYKRTYRVGVFLLPIAEELSFLLRLLYPEQSLFSFWFIWVLALLLVGWTNRRMMLTSK